MIKEAIEELREWAVACRADYGEHSSRAAEYDELSSRLEAGLGALERELAEARAESDAFSSTVSELILERALADGRSRAAEAELAERERELAEAREYNQQLLARIERGNAQTYAAEAKLAEVRRENSTMRVRLDALEANQRDDEAKFARVAALVTPWLELEDGNWAAAASEVLAALAPEGGS